MRPRSGIWVRPLLGHARAELSDYARRRGLSHAEDPTNRDRAHLRNRIRRDLMPAAMRSAGDSVPLQLARLADRAAEDEELLTTLSAELAAAASEGEGMRVDRLNGHPRPLLVRVLRDLAGSLEGETRPGAVHLTAALELLEGPDRSAGVDLPGGGRIERRGARIVARRPPPLPDEAAEVMELPWNGRRVWSATGLTVVTRIHGQRDAVSRGPGAGTRRAWFDRDKLTTRPRMHTFAPGLRLRPFGGPGSRKVSDLLAEASIPRELRRSWPVVSVDGAILWVPGVRAADIARVDAGTTRILDLSVGEGS